MVGGEKSFWARLVQATSDAKLLILRQLFFFINLVVDIFSICFFLEKTLKIAIKQFLKKATSLIGVLSEDGALAASCQQF